jgi:hypothetical protein
MDYKTKYLKYKQKYLNLKNKLVTFGGNLPDEESSLIREFSNENYYKMANFPDYSIDETRKNEYINKHTDEDTKYIIKKIVDNITYVSVSDFISNMLDLCLIYNQMKTENDIYIIIIPPQIVSGGNKSSGSVFNNIFRKSNFYATLLASNFLDINYIFDLSSIDYDMGSKTSILKTKLETLNLLPTQTDKNVHLFLADDCSYSGNQIEKFMINMNDTFIEFNNPRIKKHLLIPYFLNNQILNNIQKVYDLPDIIIDKIKSNSSSIVNINDLFLEVDIQSKLKNLKLKYPVEAERILTSPESYFGTKYLLYFNFRYADGMSVNQKVMSGQIIKGLGPVNLDNTVTNNYGDEFYPFIKNCDNKDNWAGNAIQSTPNCPDKLYDHIKYTFESKELNLHVSTRKLIDELKAIKNQT